jgi:outer membrane protein
MSPVKLFFTACALLFSSVAIAAPIAVAQASNIITIDERKVLRDSRAGKDLASKLKNIESQMKNELDPTRRSLESEGKSLQTKTQGKTREAIAADSGLMSQLQNYQKKANDFGQKRGKASQELQLTERKALADFNKALEPVLQEVVREKNADLVLSRSQVVFASDKTDVTSTIISKLDARTPSISVVRQRVPTQAAQ